MKTSSHQGQNNSNVTIHIDSKKHFLWKFNKVAKKVSVAEFSLSKVAGYEIAA